MEIAQAIKGICEHTVFDEPMKKHTTFRIGGSADIFCEPKNAQELSDILLIAKQYNIKPVIIGNGSNLLVSDKGIRGIVIKIGEKLADIEVNGTKITAGAGALLSKIANVAYKNSLSGFECLSGIPGSFGGAIYMNAGAYGAEISHVICEALCVNSDGELVTVKKEDMALSYRHSSFMENGFIIISATVELQHGEQSEIGEKMKELTKCRTEKQPLNFPSAGSTFKRPEGYFAGKLIEDCGLKGFSIGGAKVSEKHAGFVINYNNATADDVLALIEHIQNEVYKKFGVNLETEVRLTGEK